MRRGLPGGGGELRAEPAGRRGEGILDGPGRVAEGRLAPHVEGGRVGAELPERLLDALLEDGHAGPRHRGGSERPEGAAGGAEGGEVLDLRRPAELGRHGEGGVLREDPQRHVGAQPGGGGVEVRRRPASPGPPACPVHGEMEGTLGVGQHGVEARGPHRGVARAHRRRQLPGGAHVPLEDGPGEGAEHLGLDDDEAALREEVHEPAGVLRAEGGPGGGLPAEQDVAGELAPPGVAGGLREGRGRHEGEHPAVPRLRGEQVRSPAAAAEEDRAGLVDVVVLGGHPPDGHHGPGPRRLEAPRQGHDPRRLGEGEEGAAPDRGLLAGDDHHGVGILEAPRRLRRRGDAQRQRVPADGAGHVRAVGEGKAAALLHGGGDGPVGPPAAAEEIPRRGLAGEVGEEEPPPAGEDPPGKDRVVHAPSLPNRITQRGETPPLHGSPPWPPNRPRGIRPAGRAIASTSPGS